MIVENPLVSIMMPTYNHGSFVREALSSAVEQDYQNIEVVVADDGSTDDTVEIILEYAMVYPRRVVPIVGGPHLGITGNSNRNLRACRGKYIAFTAGDDVLLPGKISEQVSWMERDDRRLLCGHDVEAFDSQTGNRLYFWSEKYRLRKGEGADLIVRYHVPYCGTSIMVRSSAIPEHGYDDRISIVSDWKLWIDCLASGGVFGYIDGVYAKYRRHENNVTSKYMTDVSLLEGSFRDQLLVLNLVEHDYPDLTKSCNYARSSVFRWQAGYYLMLGRRKEAIQHLAQSFSFFPQLKTLMMFIFAAFPTKLTDRLLRSI